MRLPIASNTALVRPLASLAVAASLLTTAAAAQEPAQAPAWAAVPPTGGHLEVLDGTTILHLTGPSLESRGFAEGYLLADEIMACFTEFALDHVVAGKPLLWEVGIRPTLRMKFAFPPEDERWAAAVVAGMEAAREEGIGLGRPDRDLDALDILACAAIPDLSGFLCSSLAAWGDASADGDVLVARNLDYPSTPAIERHSMIEVHAPLGDRAGWVGVGWPGSAGCLTGLSDRGVYVAIHDVHPDEEKPGAKATPRTVMLEELLTTLTPSDDFARVAARAARQHSFVMGGNGMVAWQSRDGAHRGAAVLEIGTDPALDDGITLRTPKEGATWIACSNDYRARRGADLDCYRHAILAKGGATGRLDRSLAWSLIDDAGMSITLYRTVVDLGAGTMEVQRKTEDGWQPRVLVSPSGAVVAETR